MTTKQTSQSYAKTFENSDVAYVKYNSTSRLNAYDADISTTFEEMGTPKYSKFNSTNKVVGYGRVKKSDYDSNGVLTPAVNTIKNNLNDLSTILTGNYSRSHHKRSAWTWKLRDQYATQTIKDMVASIEVALQDKKTPKDSRLTTADAAALLDIAKTKLDIRFKTDERVQNLGYNKKYMQEAYSLLNSKIRSYNYYANKGIDYISSSELKARTSADKVKVYAKKVGTLESKLRSNNSKHTLKIRAEKAEFERRYQAIVREYEANREQVNSEKARADGTLELLVKEQDISKQARKDNEALSGKNNTLKQEMADGKKSRRKGYLAAAIIGAGLIVGAYLLGSKNSEEKNHNYSESLPAINVSYPAVSDSQSNVSPASFYIAPLAPTPSDDPNYEIAVMPEPVEFDEGLYNPRNHVEATEEVVEPVTLDIPQTLNPHAVAVVDTPVVKNLDLSNPSREKFYTLEQRLNGIVVHNQNDIAQFGTRAYVGKKNPTLNAEQLPAYNFDTALTDHENDKFTERTSLRNMKYLADELAPLRNSIPNYRTQKEDEQFMLELVGQEGITYDQIKLLYDASKVTSRTAPRKFFGIPIPFTHTTPGRTISLGARK